MKKVLIVIVASLAMGACAVPAEEGNAKKVGGAKPTLATEAKKARTVWGNGTYKVGSEIKPGQYKTKGSEFGCYWERLRGTSGDFEDVIANDTTTGPSIFTVKKTDKYIKFMLDCEWTRVK